MATGHLPGETQINDSLTGFGRFEYNFSGSNAESEGAAGNKTRLAFAGIKIGDGGSLSYGRNYGVAYDVGAYTDVLPEFGGGTWTNTDVFMTGRATGVLTWRNTDFFGLVDGLSFAVQYQGKNERDSDLQKANGDGFGISGAYEQSGFGMVAAYAKSDRTDKQSKGGAFQSSGKKAEVWGVGLKYDADSLYLAATYAETKNMTPYGSGKYKTIENGVEKDISIKGIAGETNNVELVAQYQFDSGFRPSLAYLQSKIKRSRDNNNREYVNQPLVKYIEVGSSYSFNKNMSAFVDYKINLVNKSDFTRASGVGTDNIFATGITYQF